MTTIDYATLKTDMTSRTELDDYRERGNEAGIADWYNRQIVQKPKPIPRSVFHRHSESTGIAQKVRRALRLLRRLEARHVADPGNHRPPPDDLFDAVEQGVALVDATFDTFDLNHPRFTAVLTALRQGTVPGEPATVLNAADLQSLTALASGDTSLSVALFGRKLSHRDISKARRS